MRNLKFIFAASLFFAALSCEKVETPSTTPVSDSEDGLVMLTLSTGEATKTHISNVTDANGVTEIHWDKGDSIKVFSNYTIVGDDASDYKFKMPDDFSPSGKYAKFGGEIRYNTSIIWAVYPYDKAKSATKSGVLTVSIPSSQNPTSSSFASNLNVSVAASTITKNENVFNQLGSYELNEVVNADFKNVCALLKFTAPADAANITSVTISANEPIAGDMTIDYSKIDDIAYPKVTGVSGSKSITMTGSFVGGQDYYFVVAPVSISGISMTIQANGETRYLAKKVNYALEPGVAKSLGSVDLAKMTKVSATAAHQYPDKVLSGTDVTFDLGQASASSLNLTIKKTDNTATRSAAALKSAYSSDSDWPYLPQGAYTFSGSFSSNGVNVTVPATSFSVPAPSGLSVAEFTPFTSYTKYAAGKPAEANALDGSTIYVNVTHNISSNIIANTNYSKMITVEGNAPKYNSDKSCVCFAGKDWKAHTISEITWTFDGVPVTKKITAKTVHVTGIPYEYSFDGGNYSGWTLNGGAYVDNPYMYTSKAVILQYREYSKGGFFSSAKDEYKEGFMVSPSFHIPATMNVNVKVKARAFNSDDKGLNLYVGAVSDSKTTCTSPKWISVSAGDKAPSPTDYTLPGVKMGPSSYISINCEKRKENVSRDVLSIHAVKITY